MYRKLFKPLNLYLLGLVIHLAYLVIVFSTSNSAYYGLFKKDDGSLNGPVTWYCNDAADYIASADNFIEHGTFGRGSEVDPRRTIGLPILIALFKFLFGQYWFMAWVIVQAVVSAVIYPVMFLLGKILLGDSPGVVMAGIVYMFIGAAYFHAVPFVLTDLIFAVFFFLGLYASFLCVMKQSWFMLLSAVILISFSALIRPSLVMYFIVNFFLLLFIAKKYDNWKYLKVKCLVILSTIILLLTCNISSLRMYNAYGVWTPSDLLGYNLFNCTSQRVFQETGQVERYRTLSDEIRRSESFVEKDRLRMKYSFQALKESPGQGLKYWLECAENHMLTPHWVSVGVMYRVYKRDYEAVDLNQPDLVKYLKRSATMWVVFYMFSAFNLLFVIIPFAGFLINLLIKRRVILLAALLLFISIMMVPTFLASGSARYRMPVEPLLIFFAFYQLAAWYEWAKARVIKRNQLIQHAVTQ